MTSRMSIVAGLVFSIVGGLVACGPRDAPEQGQLGDPLPDTFPVTGTGADLPEGNPLPAQPEDTLAIPPR